MWHKTICTNYNYSKYNKGNRTTYFKLKISFKLTHIIIHLWTSTSKQGSAIHRPICNLQMYYLIFRDTILMVWQDSNWKINQTHSSSLSHLVYLKAVSLTITHEETAMRSNYSNFRRSSNQIMIIVATKLFPSIHLHAYSHRVKCTNRHIIS